MTGERWPLGRFERADGLTVVPMEFEAFQSFFVVFGRDGEKPAAKADGNFPALKTVQELSGAWDVAFDPNGGPFDSAPGLRPGEFVFDRLADWTTRPEPGIKYYSGLAAYRKTFSLPRVPKGRTYLDVGVVHDMARVKLNGRDVGVVWCAPWRIEVTGAVKAGDNRLEIEVANRWANRMIGDKQPADANARTVEAPPGFLGGQTVPAGRYTFCTDDPYKADSPLLPSGLLGPVRIVTSHQESGKGPTS
jgi:hypothetical protein